MGTPFRQDKTGVGKPVRVVIQLPREEVEAIDLWGVPAGMPSRNAAVRQLVKDGLRTVSQRLTRESAQ